MFQNSHSVQFSWVLISSVSCLTLLWQSFAIYACIKSSHCIPSVQFSSVAQSCPTLCDPMNCSTPGLPVHHQLPEISSSILGTYWPGEFLVQYPIILPFHTVHRVLKARILNWFAIPFSSGPHSVRSLHHDPPVLGFPMDMAWFHWVRQGCVPTVIRLTSFLWVWFQCVCPLMPSCNTYHFTWVSLTLGVGYLFMVAPAKCSHCSLPWRKGISSLQPYRTFNVG